MGLPPNTKTTKTFQTFATINRTMDLPLSGIFATSHGKSPCDGLGGTTKRLVARASLQAPVENQIFTAYQMFEWADKNIEGIKYFYVSNNDVKTNTDAYKLDAYAVLGLITVLSPCLKESYRCDDFLHIQTAFAVLFPLRIMQ